MKLRRTAQLLTTSLLLLACGLFGGDPGPDGSGPPSPEATVDTSAGGGDLPDETFSINQSFWHSGFRVQLTDGRYYAVVDDFTDDVTYFVSLPVTFENLGGFNTLFDAPVALTTDAGSTSALFSSSRPSVPAGLSTSGEFLFEVTAGFDNTTAHLLVGGPDANRAQIPLGPGGGELVALEPSEAPVSGTISLQLIDLNITTAELRYDLPFTYEQTEPGKIALTLFFAATSRASGNWSLLPQDFTLALPNGSSVGVDGSELGSLPGSDAGINTDGLYIRFVIDDPPAGDYTLRFTPGSWFIGDDGVGEGTLAFTLP